MGEPITKQMLLQYSYYKMQVENHLERLARMRANETIPAMKESDGSKRSPGGSDRMADAIIKRLDYVEKSAPRINAALDAMQYIEQAVDALPDQLEAEVLRLRYLDGERSKPMPWTEVATHIYGDCDDKHLLAIYRLHGRALQHIQKV